MLEIAIGVIGGFLKQLLDGRQKAKEAAKELEILREENEHELAMADKHLEMMKFEAANSMAVAKLNMEGELEKAAFSAMEASYDHDRATYSNAPTDDRLIAVDVLRGKTRPWLTIFFGGYLAVFTAFVFWQARTALLADAATMAATANLLIAALIDLSKITIGWWFAASPTRFYRKGGAEA